MIKISLIDDHSLFRLGLKAIISNDKDIELVGDYGSPEEFLERWQSNPVGVDLVITDLSFDDSNGLDLIKTVKKLNSNVKVIALSMHKEEFYILSAVESGVEGYLHKDIRETEFIKAIKQVMAGESYYSGFVSQILIKNIYNKPKRSSQPFLTSREREVVNYLAKGLSTREIASKLKVSPRTIDAHRYNILGKFGLQNTTQLVRKIMEQKITF
jgi:DNA-binding NarL/FixJ family response regulator